MLARRKKVAPKKRETLRALIRSDNRRGVLIAGEKVRRATGKKKESTSASRGKGGECKRGEKLSWQEFSHRASKTRRVQKGRKKMKWAKTVEKTGKSWWEISRSGLWKAKGANEVRMTAEKIKFSDSAIVRRNISRRERDREKRGA